MSDLIQPKSKRTPHALDYIGAALVHMGVFILRLLPFGWASELGGLLASTFGPLLKPSQTARDNLKKAFPEKGEAEIEMILREVWENVGRTAFEFPLMGRLLTPNGQNRITIEGQENLQAALDTGKPVLFYAAHMGNWELPPVTANFLGFNVHVFYRAPNNPLLFKLFSDRKTPGEMIPKGAPGAKRAFALLKRGEHLGILVDQKLNDGVAVPFFGRDAMTGTAIAEFALRFDAPIVPIQSVRDGATFRIIYHPAMTFEQTGDKTTDTLTILRTINAELESWIRERPGQWLWLHNRWPDS